MRKLQRHRRSLIWIASLSSAAVVATFGASSVLAEGPACVVGDRAVSQEELALDHTLCPPGSQDGAGTDAPDPAPTAPDPVVPTDPAPTGDGAGGGGGAVPPVTADPVTPTDTTGTTGGGSTTTTDPVPPTDTTGSGTSGTTTPTPADPVPPTGTTEDGTTGTGGGTTGTKPVTTKPVTTKPVAPKPKAPAPVAPKPEVDATTERTHELVKAKQFAAAPFRDARLFREQYTPAGRIPTQPQLPQEEADALFAAAKASGVDWSLLASVSWLDSRWGDPVAGGFAGQRLTDAQWAEFGTDGNDDGNVARGDQADQVATLAAYLAGSENAGAALRAYFAGENHLALTRRALFLADYFDALGTKAVVKGLDDPAARREIEDRILADKDVEIYDGGRSDIAAGLVDPRVLVTIQFVANRFDTVAVSSIISGHGVYTSGGNVSLHSFGQAVDIAALDGEPIVGHQGPGSRTQQAVKELLLLPEAMQSAELISLWDLGMPSFAAADHDDHIHVGFKTEPVE
ncbi:MAG: peptidoglycan DD-metalloendopeptidase family protein [Thermoleophilia bacterium]|nr:peptidoglycan DD-metalloendopeptidase family protein [Thermoleophilia bacterium]